MSNPTVLVVDDAAFIRRMFVAALGNDYQVLQAVSGDECLTLLESGLPDIILLDIEMPGTDGYETCRQLKDRYAEVPVIFVSGHDREEDKLKGYDAGGDDYVTKPFDSKVLLAKVASILKIYGERRSLKEMADYAGRTAMTAMTSMGEMGVLLQALQQFNQCNTLSELARAMASGLSNYGLTGVTRVIVKDGAAVASTCGEVTPVEAGAISQAAVMGRIVQKEARLSVAYDHTCILISDFPVDDPDRCGRLRDHLAVLTEAAEGRTLALIATTDSSRKDNVIDGAVAQATRMLGDIDVAQRKNRADTSEVINGLTEAFAKAVGQTDLIESQEIMLKDLVQGYVDRLYEVTSRDWDAQEHLTQIIARLQAAH